MSETTTDSARHPNAAHRDAGEVAELLNTSRRTVTDKAAGGEFPGAFRIGNRWRFPAATVDAYIDAHTPRTHVPGTIEPRRTNRKRRTA